MGSVAYFNHTSLPAASREVGIEMLNSVVGLLSSLIDKNISAPQIVSTQNFYEYELADGYSISDYVHTPNPEHRDLALQLDRIIDRSPYIEELDDEQRRIIEFTEISLPDIPSCTEPDIIKAAELTEGFVVSLPTIIEWASSKIRMLCQDCDENLDPIGAEYECFVPNLANASTQQALIDDFNAQFAQFNVNNWDSLLNTFKPHPEFLKWLEGESDHLKSKAIKKLAFIESLGINPGEPHVKDVSESFPGNSIKEVRFTVNGNNEIRLLYETLDGGTRHILQGGQKNNDSWYRRQRSIVRNRAKQ